MGNQRFSNRAASLLAAGISAAAVSLTVGAGDGDKFPALAAGQFFWAVIQTSEDDPSAREYVTVTARAGDVLTILRAQDGTSAAIWPLGSTIAHIVPAGGFADFSQVHETVQKDSSTGAAQLPAGTTAQRPANGAGKFRYNADLGRFEGNNGAAWGSLGGATGGGNDAVFYVNGKTVTSNYTLPAGQNAMSAGPITIADGVLVDISNGSAWTIV